MLYNLFKVVLQLSIEGLNLVTGMLLFGVFVVSLIGVIQRLILIVIAYSTHSGLGLLVQKVVLEGIKEWV